MLSPRGRPTPDARRLASTPPMPSAPAASGTLRSAPSKRTAQSKSSSGGTCAHGGAPQTSRLHPWLDVYSARQPPPCLPLRWLLCCDTWSCVVLALAC